jgi:hypothetical protein
LYFATSKVISLESAFVENWSFFTQLVNATLTAAAINKIFLIAEKFNKRKKILAERKGEKIEEIAILERYISILTVGEQKDRNSLMQLTVSQLKDEFARYQLKYQNDIYLKAKLAGAQDLEEIEDWMKPI